MGDRTIIISTNIKPRIDGLPSGNGNEPKDPGAAVYWKDAAGKQRCMATDRYDRTADNLAALAATIEAMRAIKRHGGAEILERAFLGFQSLPEPDEEWWKVLGFDLAPKTRQEAEDAFRSLAKTHHPDAGGDAGRFASITRAIEKARGIFT